MKNSKPKDDKKEEKVIKKEKTSPKQKIEYVISNLPDNDLPFHTFKQDSLMFFVFP